MIETNPMWRSYYATCDGPVGRSMERVKVTKASQRFRRRRSSDRRLISLGIGYAREGWVTVVLPLKFEPAGVEGEPAPVLGVSHHAAVALLMILISAFVSKRTSTRCRDATQTGPKRISDRPPVDVAVRQKRPEADISSLTPIYCRNSKQMKKAESLCG